MKRIVSLLMVLLLAVSSAQGAFADSKATGTTIRLAESSGTVTVRNASGKGVTVRADMRLYNGYTVQTASGASAYLSLDSTKAVKLDAGSKVEVKKSGEQLEISLLSGKLFFNVDKPLESSESLNIRSSTMVTGVRGSSGWVGPTEMGMLHGRAIVTHLDLDTGEPYELEVVSGELAYSTAAAPVGSAEKREMTNADVPGIAAEAIRDDEELRAEIDRDVPNLDTQALIDAADGLLAQEAEELQTQEEQAAEESAALDEELQGVEVDQVFDTPAQVIIVDDTPSVPDGYHLVTFYVDGKSWHTEQVADGEEVDTGFLEETYPEKAGHDFMGWTIDPEGELSYDYGPVTENVNLYAQWEAQTFTVTFQDGDAYITSQSVEYGATASTPEEPTKDRCVFVGWSTEADVLFDFSTAITDDLTLYAKWTEETFTVTFVANGETWNSQEVVYGETIDFSDLGTPESADGQFAGWYTDADLTEPYDSSTTVTEDLTLYAKFGNSGTNPSAAQIPMSSADGKQVEYTGDGWTAFGLYVENGSSFVLDAILVSANEGYALAAAPQFISSADGEELSPGQDGESYYFSEYSYLAESGDVSIYVVAAATAYGGDISDYNSYDWTGQTGVVTFDATSNSNMPSTLTIDAGRQVYLRAPEGSASLSYEVITVSGALVIGEGVTLSGGSSVTIESSGVLEIEGQLSANSGSVTNKGELVISGWQGLTVNDLLTNDGSLEIEEGASLVVGSDASVTNGENASIYGSGTLTLYGSLYNYGSVTTNENGMLDIGGTFVNESGASYANYGSFNLMSIDELNGQFTNQSGATVLESGSLQIVGGSTFTNNGTFTYRGTPNLGGSAMVFVRGTVRGVEEDRIEYNGVEAASTVAQFINDGGEINYENDEVNGKLVFLLQGIAPQP